MAKTLAELDRKYEEVKEEQNALWERWSRDDHGGLTREEYGKLDEALQAKKRMLIQKALRLKLKRKT